MTAWISQACHWKQGHRFLKHEPKNERNVQWTLHLSKEHNGDTTRSASSKHSHQAGGIEGAISFDLQLLGTEIVTGCNEVVAKVIFLHLFVILFTGGKGGGGLPQCILGYQCPPPPQDQTPPPPPGPGRPPQSRHHHPHPPLPQEQTPPKQTPPPPQTRQTSPEQTPLPRTRQTPLRKQTPAYGLRAVGTHPTGMHSCWQYVYTAVFFKIPCKMR